MELGARRIVIGALLLSAWLPSAAQDAPDVAAPSPPPPLAGAPPLVVVPPQLALAGHGFTLTLEVNGELPAGRLALEVRDARGGTILLSDALASGPGPHTLQLNAPAGSGPFSVHLPDHYRQGVPFELRTIPGWLSIAPPLLAILLALLFRQVLPALLCGVWIGAWIVHDGAFVGGLRTLDHYIVGALSDGDNVRIVIFSLLLGGMVGLISRSGGTRGLVDSLTPYATNTRRGQVVTWLLGILIFFDDYANTLIVGNTMRPVTDRLRISREKLAYIVDSTAAPVASIGIVTTWIGYEVSLIDGALPDEARLDAYGVFLSSLPYNFYPVLALVFGLLVAGRCRDFGPMLTAERRAIAGKLMADTAVPLADFDNEALEPPPDKPRRWFNAVVPVLSVLAVTFGGLWLLGRGALAAQGDPLADVGLGQLGVRELGAVLGAGDSFKALLYGSAAGCLAALLLAWVQRILTLGQCVTALVNGIKSMTMAILILILAWSIGDICGDLQTSSFMVATLSDFLDPRMLPTLVFLLAAGTAFATGTSWATMAILIPLAIPTAFGLGEVAGLDDAATRRVLLGAVSAVLAGAIFGDHCSPISDTTVMSSMASGCDHLDHVRTQLPYALVVAVVAVVVGYVPAGFGVHPLLCLGLGAGMLVAVLQLFGRRAAA